jgi:gas vesicle protein
MSISSLVSRVIPATVGFVTGGPVGAATALVATEEAKKQEKKIKQSINEYNARQEQIRSQMMVGLDAFGGQGRPINNTVNTASSGFLDTITSAASRIGNTLLTGFESAVPSLINRAIGGGSRPQSAAQGPALTTITNVGAQESQGSGSIQAGAGQLLAPILQQAGRLLKSPGGQLAIGTGTGLAFSMGGQQPSGMRITRKMKSQARMVLNMTGGNIAAAADILGISDDMLVTILLKRFRNDGPVVTKAALRKTKQTIRRLHSMQDVLKSITPTTTGRRRAPMKRATTTTLIKN